MASEPNRILIVDDNEDHLEITKFFLEMENSSFQVAVVSSGEECLRTLEEQSFDCIISDYEMRPGISGIELLQEIRARELEVPFIILTDYGSPVLERQAYMSGAEAYFPKTGGKVDYPSMADSIRIAVAKKRLLERTEIPCGDTINNLLKETSAQPARIREEVTSLLERLPFIGIFVKPDASCILEANAYAADFIGRDRSTLTDIPLITLVQPSNRTKLRRMLLKICRYQRPCEIVHLVGFRGRTKPFAVAGFSILSRNQRIGILLTARPLAHS